VVCYGDTLNFKFYSDHQAVCSISITQTIHQALRPTVVIAIIALDCTPVVTQRMFYENCKGHVEGHFFGGAERPHISGNFPDFCVEIFHKKLEGFQK
jgi:hypothetical protein